MIDTAQDASNDTIGSEGIFLRTADRRRFDYVMNAVQQQSLSLSLSSENDGVLDHYGRIVINKLRKMSDLQIEVFLPQNTEALLDRFNQILAGLSLEDARNRESSPAPRRVLIAHDAKAIGVRDLQLLSRLVQDFPGANVSLVLLLDRTGIAQHEKNLDAFGQRLLRWPLEQPTRAEGESLLNVARGMGFEVEVKKVLAATGFAEIRAPQPVGDPGSFERHLSNARTRKSTSAQTPSTASSTKEAPEEQEPPSVFSEAPRRSSLLKTLLSWVLAFVLLLGVAIGTIALLFPQRLSPMLANSPTLKENLPPWMMSLVVQMAGKPTTTLPEAKPESKPAADTGPSVPPPAADSSANKSETATAKVPASADPVASTDTAPAKPADTAKPAEPAVSVTSTTDAATAKVPVEDALAPRSERGVDQMIRQAPAGSVFVQHVSVNSMAEAQEWRAQYSALTGARIAAVTTQNKGVRYIVISGPFANMKEAETFTRKDGVPADPWLRPVKSLQRGLQSAGR
ncbi:Sporulation-like domain containing protein [Oxalobacteraceae bacterium]